MWNCDAFLCFPLPLLSLLEVLYFGAGVRRKNLQRQWQLRLLLVFSDSRVLAIMELSFLAYVLHACFDTATLIGFPRSTMSCGGKCRTYTHYAALDIAVIELRRIKENCSCIKRLDHLFNAGDNLPEFSILNCDEGLCSSITSSLLTSQSACSDRRSSRSEFWDVESIENVLPLSPPPKPSAVAFAYSALSYIGGVIL